MNPLIYKLSVRYGLIIAAVCTVISIVLYLISPLILFTSSLAISFIVITRIILLIILAVDIRKNIGSYWKYWQAFLSLMIMCTIIAVISILLNFIFFKYVDSSLAVKVNDALLDVTSKGFERAGFSQDKIDEMTKPFTDGTSLAGLQPTLQNSLQSFATIFGLYALLNLILAACVKKNPPMFGPGSEQDVM